MGFVFTSYAKRANGVIEPSNARTGVEWRGLFSLNAPTPHMFLVCYISLSQTSGPVGRPQRENMCAAGFFCVADGDFRDCGAKMPRSEWVACIFYFLCTR